MATAIIDADSIAYRAAAAAQVRVWKVYASEESEHHLAFFNYKNDAMEWAGSNGLEDADLRLEIEPEDVANALSNAKTIIKTIVEDLGLSSYELHLTGKENYRFDIATIKPYKGNRDNVERPAHLEATRQYLLSRYGALMSEGCEADDTVSIDGWKAWKTIKKKRDLPYIVSIDKDLDIVPGIHYDWVKKKKYRITEKEGMYNFYKQMIIGDSTDNIQGAAHYIDQVYGPTAKKAGQHYQKRIGLSEAKAREYLDSSENLKCAVGLQYAVHYEDPEAAFEENARLLWMSKEEPNDWSWDID